MPEAPLRIDTVTTPGGGVIGMTMCPGRTDRTAGEGAMVRDLDADLAVVAAWRPDVILTLVEGYETALLKVPDLFDRLPRIARWLHLPITDGQAPDRGSPAVARTLDALTEVLGSGGRVLIHCRAGLGRTGTLAAVLLRDLGAAPAAAVAQVRAARPGTIETEAQARFVLGAAD